MKADSKHYKFINSQTGNTIHYHSLSNEMGESEIKAELEKIRAQVAVKNGLFLDIIYWEEIKEI